VDLDYFYPYYCFNEMKADKAGNGYNGGKGIKSQGMNLILSYCIKQALILTSLRGSEHGERVAYGSRKVSPLLLFYFISSVYLKRVKNSTHLEKEQKTNCTCYLLQFNIRNC